MASIKNSLQGLDMAKAMRLKQIQDEWQQFPGRAPNGTGLTGLNPNDAKGYSDMLNEQTEGMNLENEAQGKAPVIVKAGGEIGSQIPNNYVDMSRKNDSGPFGVFGAGTGGVESRPTDALLGLQQAATPVTPANTVVPGYQPNAPDLALITKAKKRGLR
jgi:hypothetical protein